MDTLALIRPEIRDRDGLLDFSEAIKDHALATEREIGRLRKQPTDHEAISSLFRAIHNIKGDAMLCRYETASAIAHPIESVLARLRTDEIVFSELLAEAILLAIDRLELATEASVAGKTLEHLNLVALTEGFEHLATLNGQALESACARLIESVTGFRPANTQPAMSPLTAGTHTGASINDDLAFFRTLAQQLDARSPMLKGRSIRVTRLALETNALAGQPIAPEQLEAAALMHDLGMLLLPDELWLKVGQLSDDERAAMRRHPEYSAGLLQRMPGWAEAALIVRQHHEMPDGKGYPSQLGAADICAGANLLSIVDAFESVILKQAHRGKSRSFLRAIAEINASPNQFAPEWIEPFNRVIRTLLERS